MTARALRSILIRCYRLPTSHRLVTLVGEQTKKYSDAATKMRDSGASPDQVRARLGLPHIA
eukprot:4082303-Alexandrium_andersonii.AAC.1